jgi:hypothetical protein
MNEPNHLLNCFLNKNVAVQIDDNLTVEGRLTSYQVNDKEKHVPGLLILDGKRLLRGDFTVIKVTR